MIDLGALPGGNYSNALDINNSGQIVGNSCCSTWSSARHAFVSDGTTMIDLNDLIDASAGITLTSANGINDLGQIVGECYDASTDSTRAFLLTPTPEPSTLVLMSIGAITMLAYVWRWQRRTA